MKPAHYKLGNQQLTVDNLIEDAKAERPQGFLRLIRKTIALVKEEASSTGSSVVGGAIKIPQSGRIIVVGDLHGDLESLTTVLRQSHFLERVQNGENIRLIFLGDYGDRGKASPEVYHVVLELKTKLPQNVVLLRGNHEGIANLLPSPHDLPVQLIMKYKQEDGQKIYKQLLKLFDCLYIIAIVEKNIALVHAGLPSTANSLEDIAFACMKHPHDSQLEEILWSDPREDLEGTQSSPRGAGKFFGSDVTERVLKILKVNVIIRGHEPCIRGFKTNHNGRILTIFSNKFYYQKACYLELDLSEKILNAKEIEPNIKQF